MSHDYVKFVESRAKRMGSLGADLHHATTGMLGEAIEFVHAKTDENRREELGDIEFYRMHFALVWIWYAKVCVIPQAPRDWKPRNLPWELCLAGGDLLDLTKKVWVYNKAPDDAWYAKAAEALGRFEAALESIHAATGYTRSAAKRDNQAKLELRYPTGYSDAAAQQRADKPDGE